MCVCVGMLKQVHLKGQIWFDKDYLCVAFQKFYIHLYFLVTKTEVGLAKGLHTEKLTNPPASTKQIHTRSLTHVDLKFIYHVQVRGA